MRSALPSIVDDRATTHVLATRQLVYRRGRRVILAGIDFAVRPGEIVAIIGANGSGKTTLLQCFAGVLKCTGSNVTLLGEPLVARPDQRQRIGYVGHDSSLYLPLTCSENLVFAARMHGLRDAVQRVAKILEIFELTHLSHQTVSNLSRGTRQRLAIARAIVHCPQLLILDEPYNNLDVTSRSHISGYFRKLLHAGCAIVYSSHDADEPRSCAHRVLTLETGVLKPLKEDEQTILPDQSLCLGSQR
jgi:heme ABC exporter ATP-binding subunit CcmA